MTNAISCAFTRKLVMEFVYRHHKRMSPVTMIGIILFALSLGGTLGYKQLSLSSERSEYAAQIKDLKKQKKQLKKEREELKDFEDYVKTDEYAEEVAREKLGLVHKGEILFVPEEK